jgi:sialic acid synthase SpsE
MENISRKGGVGMNINNLFMPDIEGRNEITPPYFIAEIGVNHECDMDMAKRLIDQAKEGGADAVKFQSYKAETLAVKNSLAYWDLKKEKTTTQYELFKKHDKFWKKEFEELKRYCDETEIEFLSTPFDVESANFLNDLMKVFKISSSDITNKPFIEHICAFGKPIILSTGASDVEEIREAVSWIHAAGNKLALMHCVLNYPTDKHNVNLGMIVHLRKLFPDMAIGYSDHSLPEYPEILVTAVLLGAAVIEKHFTYDKTMPGNDHYHAMDKDDLTRFRKKMDDLFAVLGDFKKHSIPSEENSRQFARRSLVVKKEILEGAVINENDLTFKRPGTGISPKSIGEVVGRTAKRDIDPDNVLTWDDVN